MNDRTPIEVDSGPDTIRKLTEQIDAGVLDDVYVSNGRLIHMTKVSGSVATMALDDDAVLPVSPSVLTGPALAGLLAQKTEVFRIRSRNVGGKVQTDPEEITPPREALAAVLATAHWPGRPTLRGVIGAPILRRDGTLLQSPGYDTTTGYYLASARSLRPVSDKPTADEVEAARRFVLDRFLGDFPWVGKADKANYLALLATPILRPYTRCLTPFGIISATQPGSGKTLLTAGPGLLYGQRVVPWPYADEELRKAITAVMQDSVGVVVFDNLAEGSVINSPILAQLITTEAWSDRRLGSSKTLTTPNERLWMATGNNLRIGGDMASRTVLVRLDPDRPDPEKRTGFAIPDLPAWMAQAANQADLLHHLLVLVVDWTQAGAPKRTDMAIRQFTSWAQALGGFLAHHGVEGFLENAEAVREADEDDMVWSAFLGKWHERHGDSRLTTGDLRKDAEDDAGGHAVDNWKGCFITAPNGRLPSSVGLGRNILPGRVGRHHGRYVLRCQVDPHEGQRVFWVEVKPQ